MKTWRAPAPVLWLLLIVGVYGGAMWWGMRDIPLTDDADFYLGASEVYKDWYLLAWREPWSGESTAFTKDVVDRHFHTNREHPPFAKMVMGLSMHWFHERLGWFDIIDAARAGICLLSTLLAGALFAFAWKPYGTIAAVSAPLFLLTMPRFFFHSHVETLDAAVAATYFFAVAAVWKARSSAWWSLAAGLLWSVSLAAKLNAFFVPAPVVLLWLAERRREFGFDAQGRFRVPPVPLGLVCLFLIGPIALYAQWPWMWFDTVNRAIEYGNFHFKHYGILFYYLGTIYNEPFAPWHAPFVMTLVTTPVPTLALSAVGIGLAIWRSRFIPGSWELARDIAVWLRNRFRRAPEAQPQRPEILSDPGLRERSRLDGFLLLNAFVAIGIVAFPNNPKYGGVKLFLPLFPFLALLAGVGLDAVVNLLARISSRPERLRAWLFAPITAGLIGFMGASLARIHPHHLSYYNFAVGGLPGADRAGFEIQYYDLWYLELARWLNQTYPEGVRVYFSPNNKEYIRQAPWYYRTNRLNRNIRITANESEADIHVLTHENRWPQYPELRERLKSLPVLHEFSVEGAPLYTVYKREGK
ncbi:MAG: hypothetical protein GMKNLPBB_00490 [Myxococcota bacterium]|nr:hypothetical protein [Myxococcota bacterium]